MREGGEVARYRQVVADAMKRARERAGLSQADMGVELGKALGKGPVARTQVGNWENREAEPVASYLLAAHSAMNSVLRQKGLKEVTLDQLVLEADPDQLYRVAVEAREEALAARQAVERLTREVEELRRSAQG